MTVAFLCLAFCKFDFKYKTFENIFKTFDIYIFILNYDFSKIVTVSTFLKPITFWKLCFLTVTALKMKTFEYCEVFKIYIYIFLILQFLQIFTLFFVCLFFFRKFSLF